MQSKNSTQNSLKKFSDPYLTAKGEDRASVALNSLQTLWFNTGSQCNLKCQNCYIESSPTNDRLVLLTINDVKPYLDEIKHNNLNTKEIGFTGGEPFLNPHMISLMDLSLSYGFKTLVLTNAYRLFSRYKSEILELNQKYPNKFKLRVSLDHYTKEHHEAERGENTFEPVLKNLKWLSENKVPFSIAGRTLVDENLEKSTEKYKELLETRGIHLEFNQPDSLVVFPEMDLNKDVPEITTECWSILNRSPDDMMCSTSRMVVKRKGEDLPKVLPCTLLAYDPQFEMGQTLTDSKPSVQLNHKFCAQFCVLGGASCS